MSHLEPPGSDGRSGSSVTTFDQLDTLVRVTTIQAWISLATLFAICAGAVAFAFLYRVPRKVIGEGILLIEQDRLSQVRALGSGRLVRLNVGLDDRVKANDVIGVIAQQDLKDLTRRNRERLSRSSSTRTRSSRVRGQGAENPGSRRSRPRGSAQQDDREPLEGRPEVADRSSRDRSGSGNSSS